MTRHRTLQWPSDLVVSPWSWSHYLQLPPASLTGLLSCTHHLRDKHIKTSFPLRVDIGPYVSHCIYHTFPLSVGTLLPSKVHTSPEPMRTFWSLLCGCIANNNKYQGARFECAYAVWYAVISRSTQNQTIMQYTGSGYVNFFPPCNAKIGIFFFHFLLSISFTFVSFLLHPPIYFLIWFL